MNEDNKHDALKEIFQRNLENHRIPVDSSDWEVINNRLQSKSSFNKKKTIAIWSAVAASLAIILTLAYRFEDSKIKEDNVVVKKQEVESVESNQVDKIIENNQDLKATKVLKESKDFKETKDAIEQETTSIYQEESKKEEQEKQPTEKQINKYQNNTLFATDYPTYTPKKKKELLIAASFGTSRGMGNNTTILNMDYANRFPGDDPSYLGSEKNSFSNNELIPENTDGEYSPPLSFGLSIRKNLNSHWGIETGLVYTYLSSVYRWNYGNAFDATQQLHYLGVPLNGVVYLWKNNPKWNAYVSFGAMLEKGLWMRTVRNEHFWSNYTLVTTQKSNIDGWQWSLNSSLGISYRFANKMELYAEPRISYYFDSDQPMSIRTDWPVSVGVGGGLRYSF
ncbi:MAG: outer membrane beta-barrel protein [Dysgonamonadaceae bacterium]|jgi:hypothetical protein|nr:outer membrane beta-barrel protein [Dysgonamonadaceae bacterium]